MSDTLPFSQASENNKAPIISILKPTLADSLSVLEIGAGTGQHAEYFAAQLPHLRWHSTDIPDHVDTLNLRIGRAGLPNLPAAVALDVNRQPWDCGRFDAVFTANSFHIMDTGSVEACFREVSSHMNDAAKMLAYGPFRYGGEYTTESNARFDDWLKARDPLSGIRDFEWVNHLAQNAGLQLLADHAMPANNQLLVWELSAGD